MYAYAPSNWLNLRFFTHLCDLLRLTHALSLPYAICEPRPFLRLVIARRVVISQRESPHSSDHRISRTNPNPKLY